MKIKNLLLFILISSVLFSCKTITVMPETETETITEEQENQENEAIEQQILIEEIAASVDIEKQVVYVEKPIYRPEVEKPPVENPTSAVINNIVVPENYSGSAMIYDYKEDFVYEVYTKILRITDIQLEPGEKIIGDPNLSDTVRFVWDIGINKDSKGREIQHIYIKPTAPGLETTLIINTNLRSYHLILLSYSTSNYMPMVRWRYPVTASDKLSQISMATNPSEAEIGTWTNTVNSTLPDFNFKLTFSAIRKPKWVPELVYAYEGKTYIQMPKEAFERELPGVFGEKNDLVNYRLVERTFIIDKLLDEITLKLDGKKVTIRKNK